MTSLDLAPQPFQTHQDSLSPSASSRSSSASPAPSRQLAQLNEPTGFDRAHNASGEQLERDDSSMSEGISRPVTPFQPQDDEDELEVRAQLNETAPSIPPEIKWECNICWNKFNRIQERNRHVESHLPHSILCPSAGCNWTGRRQWDFKEHWRRKHREAGEVPREDENEIYDPREYVKSIVNGTPVEEVAQTAFSKVQESLGRMGKPNVGANVLGRNRDLRKWIQTPSSRPD